MRRSSWLAANACGEAAVYRTKKHYFDPHKCDCQGAVIIIHPQLFTLLSLWVLATCLGLFELECCCTYLMMLWEFVTCSTLCWWDVVWSHSTFMLMLITNIALGIIINKRHQWAVFAKALVCSPQCVRADPNSCYLFRA
jgi:hypothetical protein